MLLLLLLLLLSLLLFCDIWDYVVRLRTHDQTDSKQGLKSYEKSEET